MFDLWSTYLGDQWSIGAWDAMREGSAERLPERLKVIPVPDEPPQNLKEYDPEWGRSFWTGTVAASCDHERMLRSVKVPAVLLTHHCRVDERRDTGSCSARCPTSRPSGCRISSPARASPSTYRSFPDVGHSMHGERPELYVDTAAATGSTASTCETRRPDRRPRPLPPATSYRTRCCERATSSPTASRTSRTWSAEEHVDAMDRLGIATSLLSISSPGVHFGDDAITRDLAREVNEDGRRAVVDHPGRFGLFASLPLPDVDAAMAEIAYCCDHLDVDGFALLTNVGGTYLGDPSLGAGLRGARTGAAPGCSSTRPRRRAGSTPSLGRPRPMLEFLFDTTRAVVDLVLNGTIAAHPDIEFIVPHAGATLPMIADRVSVFSHAARRRPCASTCSATSADSTSTWPASRCPVSSTRC